MIKNVAFIGLGNMGTPLSRHLLNAGFNVSGYDVMKEKMSALEADGLRAASSPADAARDAALDLREQINAARESSGAEPAGAGLD